MSATGGSLLDHNNQEFLPKTRTSLVYHGSQTLYDVLTTMSDSITTLSNWASSASSSFPGNAATASTWATARNFYIKDSTSAHTSSAVSVNGGGNVNLLLPSTITATFIGNISNAAMEVSSTGTTLSLSSATSMSLAASSVMSQTATAVTITSSSTHITLNAKTNVVFKSNDTELVRMNTTEGIALKANTTVAGTLSSTGDIITTAGNIVATTGAVIGYGGVAALGVVTAQDSNPVRMKVVTGTFSTTSGTIDISHSLGTTNTMVICMVGTSSTYPHRLHPATASSTRYMFCDHSDTVNNTTTNTQVRYGGQTVDVDYAIYVIG